MKTQRSSLRGFRGAAVFAVAAALALMVGALAGCSSESGTTQNNNDAPAATNATNASSVPAAEGEMTIHVTMKQEATTSEAQDSPIQFADESIDIVVPEGAMALEVLQGTDREVETSGTGDSVEVTAIGGLENGAAGEGSHWSYSVNGQDEKASPAVLTMSDGDTMVWTFVGA